MLHCSDGCDGDGRGAGVLFQNRKARRGLKCTMMVRTEVGQ